MLQPDLKNDNETLGVKHKKYNKQLQDAIAAQRTLDEKEFKEEEQVLDNLMKIDLASHKKDVDYILSVLKCRDILYVSRALHKSKWLVEDQYEHIINPHHVYDQLFPSMTTEAATKLIKFIRQHLTNESRVEEFLKNENDPKVAVKWLPRCSVPFIEKNVQTYRSHLQANELKRLCEKSVTIFDAIMEKNVLGYSIILESTIFLINTHLEKYLDTVEKVSKHERPKFNAKATNTIMKQFPERIKNKFMIYSALVHIPTFVKYFESDEIKGFLYKLADLECTNSRLPPHFYKYTAMKQFVWKMPKEEQFDFVKSHFIDKAVLYPDENILERGSEMFCKVVLNRIIGSITPSYVWYEFAPFEIAFTEIKKLIRAEMNTVSRKIPSMLKVLLICTAGDLKQIQAVLSFFIEHMKLKYDENHGFINNVVTITDIHKYDDATWILLDKILVDMGVYIEVGSAQPNCTDLDEIKGILSCLEAVIIHNLLEDKPIPEMIENKFSLYLLDDYQDFNKAMLRYQKKLSKQDSNKLFDYLYNHAKKIIETTEFNCQEDFTKAFKSLNCLLDLLLRWNKALTDYPYILEKIKDFIKIKKQNNWEADLSELYNKNKSWRIHMFEESVILSPTEDTCMNAIKHDPTLLVRYKDEVETICCDDEVSLRKLLNKLKIYWPNSLAEDWSKSYINRLNKLGNHKALIRGICAILPQHELNDIIKKYAPQQAKIDWGKIDELSLSLQRLIAKNMHFARPQPSPDDILLYAKGDYTQYALPSLLSIYYNLSRVQTEEQIPKLLDAPVSLQKHGLRLAFLKLDHDLLKKHMFNIWNISKNSSIRTVVFQLMFELLRTEKNDEKALELWELLQVFIDNLSYTENDKIYNLLHRVEDVPLCVRPMFLMKSYKFIKTLIPNIKTNRASYQRHANKLAEYTREIMEFMAPEFVEDIITEFVNNKFFVFKTSELIFCSSGDIPVLSAYLLCTTDEDIQMQRYEKMLAPVLKRSFDTWNEICEESYFIRPRIREILSCLMNDLKKYVIVKKMVIPTKMFTEINNELQRLHITENYVMQTMWKLTTRLSEQIGKLERKDDWDKICAEIGPEFGKFCLQYLKEDLKVHFPCIYSLYSKALGMVVGNFPIVIQLQIFELMLSDSNFIEAYLTILKACPNYGGDDKTHQEVLRLKKIIREHPSVEVKTHYYFKFRRVV